MEFPFFNGDVFEQKEFPYCRYFVLMLSHIDGVMRFAKCAFDANISDPNVPLVMVDENGRWHYTTEEMLEMNERLKYTKCGVIDAKVREMSE